MTDATIFAISLGVTVLGLVISWGVYRRRGAGAGLRGAAWSLVPVAAAMTGVTGFFVDLAFSPAKWAGVAVAGVAVLLYLISGGLLSRRAGAAPTRPAAGKGRKGAEGGKSEREAASGGREPKGAVERPGGDPEMAEIEEILRNRGIQ